MQTRHTQETHAHTHIGLKRRREKKNMKASLGVTTHNEKGKGEEEQTTGTHRDREQRRRRRIADPTQTHTNARTQKEEYRMATTHTHNDFSLVFRSDEGRRRSREDTHTRKKKNIFFRRHARTSTRSRVCVPQRQPPRRHSSPHRSTTAHQHSPRAQLPSPEPASTPCPPPIYTLPPLTFHRRA